MVNAMDNRLVLQPLRVAQGSRPHSALRDEHRSQGRPSRAPPRPGHSAVSEAGTGLRQD